MQLFKTIGTGTASNLIANFIAIAVSAISIYLLLNALTVDEFGKYSVWFSFFALITVAIELGSRFVIIPMAAEAAGKKDYGAQRGIYATFMKMQMAVAVFAAAVMLLAYYLFFYQSSYEYYFLLLLLSVIFGALDNVAQCLMLSNSNFMLLSSGQIIKNVGKALLLFLCLYTWDLGVRGAALATFVSFAIGVLASLAFAFFALRKLRGVPSKVHGMRELFLNKGWACSSSLTVFKSIFGNAPIWIGGEFGSYIVVGLYSSASKILTVFSAVVSSLETTLIAVMPTLIGEGNEKKLAEVNRRMVKYGVWISLPITVLVIAALPPVISALIPEYADATLVLQILSLEIIVLGASVSQKSILFAYRKQESYLYAVLISTAVLFIAGVPLTSIYGAPGLAVAVVASSFALLAFNRRVIEGISSDYGIGLKFLLTVDKNDRMYANRLFKSGLGKIKTAVYGWADMDNF